MNYSYTTQLLNYFLNISENTNFATSKFYRNYVNIRLNELDKWQIVNNHAAEFRLLLLLSKDNDVDISQVAKKRLQSIIE